MAEPTVPTELAVRRFRERSWLGGALAGGLVVGLVGGGADVGGDLRRGEWPDVLLAMMVVYFAVELGSTVRSIVTGVRFPTPTGPALRLRVVTWSSVMFAAFSAFVVLRHGVAVAVDLLEGDPPHAWQAARAGVWSIGCSLWVDHSRQAIWLTPDELVIRSRPAVTVFDRRAVERATVAPPRWSGLLGSQLRVALRDGASIPVNPPFAYLGRHDRLRIADVINDWAREPWADLDAVARTRSARKLLDPGRNGGLRRPRRSLAGR